jgi:radical SAM superfamily enzyme YgiQ (UPF0313 family)
MKILLVQPNTSTFRGTLCPPLGLMFVASVVREAGHKVKIVDRNIDFFSLSIIKKFDPDIAGITAFTGPMIKDGIRVSKMIKQIFGQDFPIVWGGIHPTLLPEQTISAPYIDYIVCGEGEYGFLELVEALENNRPLQDVKGIGYKKDGKVIITEERPFIKDLDELPPMPWDLVRAKCYLNLEIVLVTSRGCPHNCAFCYNQRFNRQQWRGWSAKRTLEEIRRIEKLTKNRHLKFHDDNFTANRRRFYEIMDGLSSEYSLYIETRAEYVTEEFLSYLKRFRKVWLFIGVESGSSRLLHKMNKSVTHEEIRRAFKLCQEKRNIFTCASVILGLPTETKRELDMTIKFAKELKPDWITYCLFTPYPGSNFYKELINQGFNPPDSLEKWSGYTPDIAKADISSFNITMIDPSFLKRLNRQSWLEVFLKMIKRGDIHKIYRRFKDYTPFLVSLVNRLRER